MIDLNLTLLEREGKHVSSTSVKALDVSFSSSLMSVAALQVGIFGALGVLLSVYEDGGEDGEDGVEHLLHAIEGPWILHDWCRGSCCCCFSCKLV